MFPRTTAKAVVTLQFQCCAEMWCLVTVIITMPGWKGYFPVKINDCRINSIGIHSFANDKKLRLLEILTIECTSVFLKNRLADVYKPFSYSFFWVT